VFSLTMPESELPQLDEDEMIFDPSFPVNKAAQIA
jgi:hypothetical protein